MTTDISYNYRNIITFNRIKIKHNKYNKIQKRQTQSDTLHIGSTLEISYSSDKSQIVSERVDIIVEAFILKNNNCRQH